MKGLGIKLKIGSFQEHSFKKKKKIGVDLLDCNEKQIQICMSSVKGRHVRVRHFIQLRKHSPAGSPALSCGQLLDQYTEAESKSPPGGRLPGTPIKDCKTNVLFESAP